MPGGILISVFRAFLDTNVLYPFFSRDLLLRLAEVDLFVPLWSNTVLDELRENLAIADIERLFQQMHRAFPHANVQNYLQYVDEIELPDERDRHVVAAAFVSNADYVVTENLRDFPDDTLAYYELEAISLDDFLLELVQHDLRATGWHCPKGVCDGLRHLRTSLSRPPMTHDDLIEKWVARGLHRFVQAIKGCVSCW